MRSRAFQERKTALAALATALFLSPLSAWGIGLNSGIEDKVREAFPDAPVMVAVAKCESGFRQFAPDGSALRGGSGKGYIGIFQIGEKLHAEKAAALGHDIFTVEGNIGYARRLYDAQGSAPWRECLPAAPASTAGGKLTVNMSLGMRHAEVAALQKALNALGHAVAAAGPGSAGRETEYFGALTREAVRRFQCAQGIVCGGDERTTGYGRVGPLTRAALNRAMQ